MRILLVSSYLPYPLLSGGQVRLYNLIQELSARHEITLVCEIRPNQTEKDIQELEKICKKVITVKRRKQWSAANIAKSLSSKHSFLLTGHTLAEMQQAISELLQKESFDLIHVETFYVMQNVPPTKVPIVLVEHNIEYTVYEKFKNRALLLLRPLLAIDIAKIRKEEALSWKRANALVAVSNDDKEVMKEAGFDSSLVANGVNIEQFAFKGSSFAKADKGKKILFIGDFTWIQNIDSVTFIIKEIWPLISEKFDCKLWIVGRKIPDSIKALSDDPNVLFDEKSSAKPTPEIFKEASLLLAPIRVGGGTSYKILESMSSGTPVVTMQLSADAIEATDNQHIMVGQSAEELASKTIQLLENTALYEKVSKQARLLVEETYTWKAIAADLEKVYKDTKNV